MLALAAALILGACGDDGTWADESPPPLNAGPGANALYTPLDDGAGGLLGDWFECRNKLAAGHDACAYLYGHGYGFRADGAVVDLVLKGTIPHERGTPYCEEQTGYTYSLSGRTLTVWYKEAIDMVVNFATPSEDRAFLTTEAGKMVTFFHQQPSLSVGPCR